MWIADRVARIRPSGVRRIFDLARTVKDPVDLSLGEPDFDVPEALKEEAVRSIRSGFNKYTPSGGVPELREKVLQYVRAKGVICEDVIITPGVTGGLLLAFMVTLNPGDEVIIPDPYFVLYEYQVLLLGGKPVFFDTYPDFKLREEELRAAVSARTKVILINSPNNPTGAVYSGAELEMVAQVAREKDLLVFSDDIYDRFVFNGSPGYFGRLYENTLTFGGFSKDWGMTGWRIGFVAEGDHRQHGHDAAVRLQRGQLGRAKGRAFRPGLRYGRPDRGLQAEKGPHLRGDQGQIPRRQAARGILHIPGGARRRRGRLRRAGAQEQALHHTGQRLLA